MPLFDVRTMAQREELSLSSRRTSMLLGLAFGVLALFLAALGIYGVLAYLVAQRRKEIGIRVALGSTLAGIVKLVLREGLTLVGTGLILGTVGSISLRSIVQNEIYGVAPLDPLVLGCVAIIFALVALVACACLRDAQCKLIRRSYSANNRMTRVYDLLFCALAKEVVIGSRGTLQSSH